jgi:hypothetical protein
METTRWTQGSKALRHQGDEHHMFERMLYFFSRVLKPAFERSEQPKLEVEISRLFRSTAFNIAHRKQ